MTLPVYICKISGYSEQIAKILLETNVQYIRVYIIPKYKLLLVSLRRHVQVVVRKFREAF